MTSITVTAGVGEGATELSAFDRALYTAGIANFNLLVLSSVIPADAQVALGEPKLSEAAWGDRLYVVMADTRQSAAGSEAWAGIGWVQNEESGAGLFVEHSGNSKAEVESQVEQSLTSMTAYRPQTFGPIQTHTIGVECAGRPVCALVAAVYQAEGWDQ
jgi:arginine decarboxylase